MYLRFVLHHCSISIVYYFMFAGQSTDLFLQNKSAFHGPFIYSSYNNNNNLMIIIENQFKPLLITVFPCFSYNIANKIQHTAIKSSETINIYNQL